MTLIDNGVILGSLLPHAGDEVNSSKLYGESRYLRFFCAYCFVMVGILGSLCACRFRIADLLTRYARHQKVNSFSWWFKNYYTETVK